MTKDLLIPLIIFLSILNLIINQEAISAKKGNEHKLSITLFEEFPSDENFAKLELLDFPVNIFIAAHSISEFNEIEDKVKKYSSVDTIGYWPTLEIEEGYWISAFSKREGIERIIKELKDVERPLSVLWDAELPHLRKRLFLTELPRAFGNRKIIQNFVAHPPENITLYVAENRSKGVFHKLILKIFAATFEPDLKYNRIEMLYGQLSREMLEKSLKVGTETNENYFPAFGAIAEGIADSARKGSWMRISPQKLNEHLSIAKKLGIKKLFIYRLGGLNDEYLEVIRKYIK